MAVLLSKWSEIDRPSSKLKVAPAVQLGVVCRRHPPPTNMLKIASASSIFVCLFGSIGESAGDGVLIYKNQSFHSDALARVVPYETARSEGFVTWITAAGKTFRFEKTQYFICVDLFDDLPPSILTREESAQIASRVEQMASLSTRFKEAAPHMAQSLTLLREADANLRAGKVRQDGQWITREKYEEGFARKELEAVERLAKAKAKRMAESEALAKLAQTQREAKRAEILARFHKEIGGLQMEIRQLQGKNLELGRRLADLTTRHHE